MLTAAQLRALLTNGVALPCCPVRFEVDGSPVEFVARDYRCRATEPDCNGSSKPAEVPTIVLRLTRGVGGGAVDAAK